MQKDYEKFTSFIPTEGKADTLEIELLRLITNLYYDFCNNGNGNVREKIIEYAENQCYICSGDGTIKFPDGEVEDCDDCGGEGWIEEEVDWEYVYAQGWEDDITFLREHLPKSNYLIDRLEDLILFYEKYNFDDSQLNRYDVIVINVLDLIKSKLFIHVPLLGKFDISKYNTPKWIINKYFFTNL